MADKHKHRNHGMRDKPAISNPALVSAITEAKKP
ncbi:hypothetical protein GGR98_001325 [Parageobacillus caldoxylosilyticus]|nr:hypothetical protein [Parageobacillus caldoxylosilyticus]